MKSDQNQKGALEPVPEQQAAIAKAKAMRAGGASLRAIASALREEGHNLSHMGVKLLLDRDALDRDALDRDAKAEAA